MLTPRSLPTPEHIVAGLDRLVFGQQSAKRALALSSYKHFMGLAHQGAGATPAFGPQHALLIGPTGCGKTLLVRQMAKELAVPVAFCTATTLVESGYVGEQVESLPRALLAAAGGDLERAERGIVFLDEIDKIRRAAGGIRDVSGEGVQNALLSLLDGIKVAVGKGAAGQAMDTSQILFLCAGAFVGIEDLARRRTGSRAGLGFGSTSLDATEVPAKITTEDLIGFGLIPEFIGRFANIVQLHDLSVPDLEAILSLEGSAFGRSRAFFACHGVSLDVTPGAMKAMAEKAAQLRTGARGLNRVIAEVLGPIEWQVATSQRPIKRLLVTEDVVRTGQQAVVYYRKEGSSSCAEHAAELRKGALAAPALPGALLANGIPYTSGWSDAEVHHRLEQVKLQIGFKEAAGAVRKWWSDCEQRNLGQVRQLLRLAESLLARKATITEFHLASAASSTDGMEANIHYLDYLRAKQAHAERQKRDRETDGPESK